MKKSAADIVADPEWLAHRYDEQGDTFQYRHVTRGRHAEVGFATDDYLGKEPNPIAIGREEAARLLGKQAPIHFIFHSAFCASTMLVRALDAPGSAMGISEPVILNDMAGWRGRGAEISKHAKVMEDALGQLSRPWNDGEAVVIKPSNIFNGLSMGALALRPQARALLLHAPLKEFLLSVARKGMWCRLWARELLEILLGQGMVDLGFEPRDYFRQTDLQIAGVGWLAQQMQFHRIAKQFGPGRIASLDSETLTGDPAASVARVATHFGLGKQDPGGLRRTIRQSGGTANPVPVLSAASASLTRLAPARSTATRLKRSQSGSVSSARAAAFRWNCRSNWADEGLPSYERSGPRRPQSTNPGWIATSPQRGSSQ